MHACLKRWAHQSMLPTIVPTMMRALIVKLRGVGGLIVCQVNRLLLPPLGDLDQRRDVAVVQCARELQAPVDPHADAPAEEFFRSDRRTELTSALRFVTDLVETLLNPARIRSPRRGGPPGGGSLAWTWPTFAVRA